MGVARLFDAYALLLTKRQQALLRMYYHEDFSLGEIAGRLGVTRQAVFDSLRRSVAEMEHLERRLRILAGRARATRSREVLGARLAAVELEVVRLSGRGGVDLRPLRRAIRALRDAALRDAP
jgi:predicted DNA-binding protein YlxM (UPF0122 family)